jgi:hypothetical protein
MLHHFRTVGICRDESPDFHIFDGHFFNTDFSVDHFSQLLLIKVLVPGHDSLVLDLVEEILDALQQTIKCHFSGIGNKIKDGMLEVIVYGLEHIATEPITQQQ